MILSDKTIHKMLEEGSLVVDPVTEGQVQPASVDIRLGDSFSIVDDTADNIITMGSEIQYKTIKADRYLCCPVSLFLRPRRSILNCPMI